MLICNLNVHQRIGLFLTWVNVAHNAIRLPGATDRVSGIQPFVLFSI